MPFERWNLRLPSCSRLQLQASAVVVSDSEGGLVVLVADLVEKILCMI